MCIYICIYLSTYTGEWVTWWTLGTAPTGLTISRKALPLAPSTGIPSASLVLVCSLRNHPVQLTLVNFQIVKTPVWIFCWHHAHVKSRKKVPGKKWQSTRGNVNRCSHYEKQYGGSSKSKKQNYIWSSNPTPEHMTQRDGVGREVGGGSEWGTHVHPWLIYVNVWQNHYI